MRSLTYILDLLVIAFFVAAVYRINVQENDEVIREKQQTKESNNDKLDQLNDLFDEEDSDSADADEPAVAVPAAH